LEYLKTTKAYKEGVFVMPVFLTKRKVVPDYKRVEHKSKESA